MTGPAARAYPGPGHAVLMTLALLALQVLCGIAAGIALLVGCGVGGLTAGMQPIPPAGLVAINIVAFAGIIGWGTVANRRSASADWYGRRPGATAWLAALVATLGLTMLVFLCGSLLQKVLPMPKGMVDLFVELMDWEAHPVASVLAVMVVPAVAEEWLFRGLILRGLLDHLRPAAAVWLSAGLFAAMHVNLWQLPVGLALGLFCGAVYLRTRSLVLCVAIHGVNNAIALGAEHLPFPIPGVNDEGAGGAMPPWWFGVLAGALLAGGGLAFRSATSGAVRPPCLPDLDRADTRDGARSAPEAESSLIARGGAAGDLFD